MQQQKFEFSFEVYDNIGELAQPDQQLLNEARRATETAYAPYSNFHVGAAAKLSNGKIITGSNQENASFPVGICAERVLLSTASSLYPGLAIETIAVSYVGKMVKSDHPISPCGMCRQSLLEFESRLKQPIRLILGGAQGPIYIIQSVSQLLPLAFTSEELS
jgi:cytidine deaminase